ncbi:MAG: RagB/SusD family nutrient uptake outer membrane protein [Cyclobacteriaceae bacterium]
MKKSLKYISLSLALVFTMSSCEDFLEETNPNNVSTDSFWLTMDDLQTGLIAVYNSWKDGSVLSIPNEYNRTDMTWPGWGRPNTTNVDYLQTFNESSEGPNAKWRALYKGIFRANQVIKATENLMGTFGNEDQEEEALEVLAQARFFRGLFYFYLHNSFNNGSVVIIDFVPEDEPDFYNSVSPAEEVQTFFREDLEFALENLPPSWPSNERGRVTAGAAGAVLGKSYLYSEDYDIAAEYFKDVIENPDYGYALTSVWSNFTTFNELNSESILEVVYSLNYKSSEDVFAEEQNSTTLAYQFSPVGGWRSVLPSLSMVMAYKNDAMDVNNPINWVPVVDANGNQLLKTDGTDSLRMRDYSLRTSFSLALVDDRDVPYYGTTTARATFFNNLETAYFRKNTNWDLVTNETDIQPAVRSGINVRVIRLADVYLMYAESLIKGGTDESGLEEALMYVNRVRNRSALQLLGMDGTGEFPVADHDDVVYDAQSLMEHLMYVERPLELAVEGNAIRHIDMRRWGITKQRFQELSTKEYSVGHYRFFDDKGEKQTRWASVLFEGDGGEQYLGELNPGDEGQATVIDERLVDYAQAAANYIESAHAYWPLPSGELIANPVLTDD